MNKVFKKVFNAARGVMMVVNETTSSVQTGKKAAVTVAVLGALVSGTAMASDYVYNGESEINKGSDVTVVISNQEIKNKTKEAKDAYGGALRVSGGANVTMDNVTIDGNNAKSSTGVSQGGAYHQALGNLTAKNITVTNNKTEGLAGLGNAMLLNQVVGEISGSKFENNVSADVDGSSVYGREGGALHISTMANWGGKRDSSLTITETEFNRNSVVDNYYAYGGAINVGGGKDKAFQTLKLVKVSFNENKAQNTDWGIGGAIYSKNAELIIEDSQFNKNEATTYGGAIATRESSGAQSSSLTIKNTTFDGNKAGDSGGALDNCIAATITDTDFTSNEATYQGGAIYNEGDLTFKGTNTFTDNVAQEGNDVYNTGTVTIADGKTTFNSGIVSTGTVAVEAGATLAVGGTSDIALLTGSDATLEITSTDVTITKNEMTNTSLVGSGEVNDALNGDAEAFIAEVGGDVTSVAMAEGDVMGAVTADVDGGKLKNVVEKVNQGNQAKADKVTHAPRMLTRVMMNDLRKRMGDVRAGEGDSGLWARYNGGEMSGQGLETDFNMIQVGIDTVPTPDSMRFGLAFSYAQSESTDGYGSADMDSYSLAAYGIWTGEQGQFIDVIGRIATMDTELGQKGQAAKFDNLAVSLSGEYGWRFDLTDRAFVEPSAELTYTHVNAETFKMGRVEHELDSTDSLVGRVGVAAGLKCPNNKGEVYVRAAAVHEFMGDTAFRTTAGQATRWIEADGKDTWFEYALGANFNVNKNTYVYADIERTGGAEFDEDWRANVGVRYSF